MIANLISKAVRTVYDKKVVRLTLDVPYDRMESGKIDGEEMMKWLDNRVDSEISVSINTLDDDDQGVLGDGDG